MRVIAGTPPETSFASRALIVGVSGFLAIAALSPVPLVYVAPAAAFAMAIAAWHRSLLSWTTLLTALLVVIMFVPIRRYTLGPGGGFQLEPYRILVALIVLGWAIALLIDRRVKLRASGLEAPIVLIMLSIVGSITWNAWDISMWGLRTDVIKALTFFLSFFFIFYVIVSVVRPEHVRRFVELLVFCGAIVAVLSIFEAQTGTNVFDKVMGAVPFMHSNVVPDTSDALLYERGDRLRVLGPAEHPIALSAAMAMLLPMGIALGVTGSKRWWLAVLPLGMATLATLSRTGVLMLIAVGIVFLCLRPSQTIRRWYVIIPLLAACNIVMPHTLGILKSSFFPQGGLIAEQKGSEGSATAGGRATDFSPVLARVRQQPLFGVGFATTVVPTPGQPPPETIGVATPPVTRILDNQWLGIVLETGWVGVFAWLWFYGRFIRRLGRFAKRDESDDGWLAVGIVAAVTANAIGIFTYDGYAFIQATFIMFILIAFGVVLGRGALVRSRPAANAASA
jgi:hypothetical protein